jgi:hypothetical protein
MTLKYLRRRFSWTEHRTLGFFAPLALAIGCGGSDAEDDMTKPGPGAPTSMPTAPSEPPSEPTEPPTEPPAEPGTEPNSPFKTLDAAANAPESFSQPRAGTPLPDGSIAFVATLETASAEELETSGERGAVFRVSDDASAPELLYAGEQLSEPLDIDVSLDGKTLFVADPSAGPDGEGALLALSTEGGEPELLAVGFAPRSVTVGPDDRVYFSGTDPESGEAGVFLASGSGADAVFAGAPLVDPSGIAVFENGALLVADTRSFDAVGEDHAGAGEASIVRVEDGEASVFASGFATGYPAGIALTLDEKTLIISGESPDRSDSVYVVDVTHPDREPTLVQADFSKYQDASAGLKRAHDSNTFVWSSLAADGGTVFRITTH